MTFVLPIWRSGNERGTRKGEILLAGKMRTSLQDVRVSVNSAFLKNVKLPRLPDNTKEVEKQIIAGPTLGFACRVTVKQTRVLSVAVITDQPATNDCCAASMAREMPTIMFLALSLAEYLTYFWFLSFEVISVTTGFAFTCIYPGSATWFLLQLSFPLVAFYIPPSYLLPSLFKLSLFTFSAYCLNMLF